MKTRAIKLVLIFVMAFSFFGHSQSTNWDQIHLHIYNKRYWYYRYRLINDFMVVGNNMTSTYSFDNLKNSLI